MTQSLECLADFTDTPIDNGPEELSWNMDVITANLGPLEVAKRNASLYRLPHISYSFLELWLDGSLAEAALKEHLQHMKVHYYTCDDCQSLVESYRQRKTASGQHV